MNNDLISRSALLKRFGTDPYFSINSNDRRIFEIVTSAPTVDAELVRHGRWEHGMRCTQCGQIDLSKPNYCPNCGAKMDGKECVPRKCGTCSNDGWDMPQCRECNEVNGFKWYKRKMDAEVKSCE